MGMQQLAKCVQLKSKTEAENGGGLRSPRSVVVSLVDLCAAHWRKAIFVCIFAAPCDAISAIHRAGSQFNERVSGNAYTTIRSHRIMTNW